MDTKIIGLGVYTLQEAALYGGVESQRLSRWVWGTKRYDPVIEAELKDEHLVSFHDLVQAKAIQIARDAKIPLRKIRQAIRIAQEKYNVRLPLAKNHKLLWFEGELYIDLNGIYQLSGSPDQIGMKRIIEPFAKDLHFDQNGLACMWMPYRDFGRTIVLDPNRLFGQPLVENTGYRADVLANSCVAEGSPEEAAEAFNVAVEDIKVAIAYMNSIKKAAA